MKDIICDARADIAPLLQILQKPYDYILKDMHVLRSDSFNNSINSK